MKQLRIKNRVKGISLITLVITIVVIIILTAAIVLSISQNNPIDKAKEASFKTNVTNYMDELSLWIGKEYADKLGDLNLDEVNATKTSGTYNNLKIKDIIASMKTEDLDKFEIQKGILVYTGANEQEKLWVQEIGTGGSISNPTTPEEPKPPSKDPEKEIIGDGSFGGVTNTPKIPSNNSNEKGMTPVIYDEGQSKWIEVTNEKEWYNYDNKLWANATTQNESFFVWIPRYAYKITSGYHTATAGTIDIIFLQGNTNKDKDGNDIPADYIVHPAFKFDKAKEGIWIGKYESSSENNQQGTSGDKVKIVPNVVSWGNINVATMFNRALSMATENNLINTNTHMMKNTEWGVASYLAHSNYGRNKSEVTVNNNSNFKTGFAGGSVSASKGERENIDTFAYNTPRGVLASTTGNITGIYDMSGGLEEYVMGVLPRNLSNSGFGVLPESKYYNSYKYGETPVLHSNYEINSATKGDATYETSSSDTVGGLSWFSDYSGFVKEVLPWFRRGGGYNSSEFAGIFAFGCNSGYQYENIGFRTVLIV